MEGFRKYTHIYKDALDKYRGFQQTDQVIENCVPGHYKCQTINAEWLYLWDVSCKVENLKRLDIGGTYSEDVPDIWFYYTINKCNLNVLITIFALHRRCGTLNIGISDTNKLDIDNVPDDSSNSIHCLLSRTLTWKTLTSVQNNTSHHIKTYVFSEDQMKFLSNKSLCISISIKLNPKELDEDLSKILKIKHSIAINSYIKQKEMDFILESSSHKQYPTHKLLLVASSPVIRDIIRNSSTNNAFINVNDKKMEIIVQWVKTGTIENIENQNASDIIEVADKFKFNKLKDLIVFTLNKTLNVDNAIEFAILSKKYNLEELEMNVLQFIKNNEQVFQTQAWKDLKDVDLTKRMLESIHIKK